MHHSKMIAKTQLIIYFWVLFNFDDINCRPTQNGRNGITPSSLLSQHDIKEDSTNSNSGEMSDKISSIADSSGKIANNFVSTFESTGKILSNIIEAKTRIAGPIINASIENLNTLQESNILGKGVDKIQTIVETGVQKSSHISKALAKSASSTSRNEKSGKSDNISRSVSESDDLTDSIGSILDSSSKFIRKLFSTMIMSAEIIGDVVEAKRKVLEPVLDNTAKSLNILSESNTIERSLKTAQTLVKAGVQTSVGVSAALARAGSSATPALVHGINSVNDVTLRVVRVGICAIICPLQDGVEKESCQKENCGTGNERKNAKTDENEDLQSS